MVSCICSQHIRISSGNREPDDDSVSEPDAGGVLIRHQNNMESSIRDAENSFHVSEELLRKVSQVHGTSSRTLIEELYRKNIDVREKRRILKYYSDCKKSGVIPSDCHVSYPCDSDAVLQVLKQASEKIFQITYQEISNEYKREAKKLNILQRNFSRGLNEDVYKAVLVQLDSTSLRGTCSKNVDKIINLSDKKLDMFAESLLSRGLNFELNLSDIPYEEITCAIELCLESFEDKETAQSVRKEIIRVLNSKKIIETNVMLEEMEALHKLKDDESLVILSHCKEDTAILINREKYKEEFMKLIEDCEMTESINPSKSVMNKVINAINGHCIPKDLRLTAPHFPKFYGVVSEVEDSDLKLKMMVDLKDTITYSILKYIIERLNKYISTSYVRNADHFAESLNSKMKTFSSPVEMLKLNLKIKDLSLREVLQHICYLAETYLEKSKTKKILEILYDSLYFFFDSKYYCAKNEEPFMNSSLGLIVDDIYIHEFMDVIMFSIESQLRSNGSEVWFRNSEEIFIITSTHRINSICKKVTDPNNSIKFSTTRGDKVVFLNSQIQTGLDGTLEICEVEICKHRTQSENESSYKSDRVKNKGFRNLFNKMCISPLNDTICEEEKKLCVYLPQVPANIANKMVDILRKYDIEVSCATKLTLKEYLRSSLFRIEVKSYAGIYRINCKQCDYCYIGQTIRQLYERLGEYEGYIKKLKTKASAVAAHAKNCNHKIDIESPIILWTETKMLRRLDIKECIEIAKMDLKMNRNKGYKLDELWKCFYVTLNDVQH